MATLSVMAIFVIVELCRHPFLAFGYVSKPTTRKHRTLSPTTTSRKIVNSLSRVEKPPNHLLSHETEIAIYTSAFASSHIGMSAIRQSLIGGIGRFADELGWVATGMRLPDFWPGDEIGGQEIFPSQDIAGRQLYRILYTFVSLATLGLGFGAYLQALSEDATSIAAHPFSSELTIYYAIASISGSISITSLINPSPLSLVPVYEAQDDDSSCSTTNGDKSTSDTPSSFFKASNLRRKDSQKLQAYGLTRITRHPLILPVVPWGLTTAMIMGGHQRDFLLFGILSIYAIAGCAAQDMRILNEEGSVGTVFDPDASLQEFFQQTSFWPFGAIVDSRQSWQQTSQEIKWWLLLASVPIAFKIEESFVNFLQISWKPLLLFEMACKLRFWNDRFRRLFFERHAWPWYYDTQRVHERNS